MGAISHNTSFTHCPVLNLILAWFEWKLVGNWWTREAASLVGITMQGRETWICSVEIHQTGSGRWLWCSESHRRGHSRVYSLWRWAKIKGD